MTVIDGATNTTTTVPAGNTPEAVAVNPVTNKIYVIGAAFGRHRHRRGHQHLPPPCPPARARMAVAVNPVTNKIYVANPQQ